MYFLGVLLRVKYRSPLTYVHAELSRLIFVYYTSQHTTGLRFEQKVLLFTPFVGA